MVVQSVQGQKGSLKGKGGSKDGSKPLTRRLVLGVS
jgi:hypothetical protein